MIFSAYTVSKLVQMGENPKNRGEKYCDTGPLNPQTHHM